MAMLHRLLLTMLLLLGAGAAAAQQSVPAERWALMADGRPLMILELRRDAAAPGGWAGFWERPDRFSISQAHQVSDVRGPIVRRAVLSAKQVHDDVELVMEGRPGTEPDRYRFRRKGRDHAELGWIDPLAIPPIPLVRADAGAVVAAQWDPSARFSLTTPRPSNTEMKAIFEADQADRRAGHNIDWAAVAPRDEARRARTRQLLEAGALQSGDDFWHAAFVFQHGGEASSYLLAHTLAVVASARGRPDATWIAAATLDRYLQSIGQPQVYGTQYGRKEGSGWSQEPYDRALLSDALRAALGVPSLAQQAERLREMEAERRKQERAE